MEDREILFMRTCIDETVNQMIRENNNLTPGEIYDSMVEYIEYELKHLKVYSYDNKSSNR